MYEGLIAHRTPELTYFFKACQFLSSDSLYLFGIASTYWLWIKQRQTLLKIALLLCSSSLLNLLLKSIFAIPRPDQINFLISIEPSFGFPSGDVQVTATIWFYIAWITKRWSTTGLSLLIVTLVAMSRLYLGVHSVVDVLGGAFIGFVTSWIVYRFRPKNLVLNALTMIGAAALIILSLLMIEPWVSVLFHVSGALTGLLALVIFTQRHQIEPSSTERLTLLIGLLSLLLLYSVIKHYQRDYLMAFVLYVFVSVWIFRAVPYLGAKLAKVLQPHNLSD